MPTRVMRALHAAALVDACCVLRQPIYETRTCAASLQEIKERQHASYEELKQLEDAFKLTTDVVWQIWGDRACRYPFPMRA